MAKRSRKRSGGSGMAIIAVVVCIFCIVLMYNSFRLGEKLDNEQMTLTELQAQIEEQKEIKAALEEKSDYMNSDDYYKELAREKLGLAGSDDIIFKKE